MKIFLVDSDRAAHRFYAGKTEASKEARQCAADSGGPVNVFACTLLPGKDGIVALANGYGWQDSSEIVYTAKPRKRQIHGAAAGCHGTDEDDIEGLM